MKTFSADLIDLAIKLEGKRVKCVHFTSDGHIEAMYNFLIHKTLPISLENSEAMGLVSDKEGCDGEVTIWLTAEGAKVLASQSIYQPAGQVYQISDDK